MDELPDKVDRPTREREARRHDKSEDELCNDGALKCIRYIIQDES
jgi:hypothetical protein